MNQFLRMQILMAGVLFAGCQTEKPAGTRLSQAIKPNILLIVTDDLRGDALGCSGNPTVSTPSIDEIAATGVRFTNCYIMGSHHGAVCAPSRAMLMSGMSMFKVDDDLEGVTTLPGHFRQHGYRTFGTGKWHNGADSFERSFSEGRNVFLGGMSNPFQVPCTDLQGSGGFTEAMEKGYSTDVFTESAMEFLEEYAVSDATNPFFCYLAYTAPHDPRSPREDYTGIYPEEEISLPANFRELHPFEFDDLNIRDETLAPWPRTPAHIRATLADYYAMITHVDHRIGDVITLLKKTGLYDNTIIVFTSDNGLAAGSHGLLGKQNLYEHSIRVPLIIAGPGIPQGAEVDALAYLYDLFPTLADLCDINVPKTVDGINLAPVLKGEKPQVRNSLYLAYRNTIRAIRRDNWKLIWYLQRKHIQLFNLEEDPHEVTNLAGEAEQKTRIIEMMDQINRWHEVTGDTATLHPSGILPMEYDFTKLRQIPDPFQTPYVLERFFTPKTETAIP